MSWSLTVSTPSMLRLEQLISPIGVLTINWRKQKVWLKQNKVVRAFVWLSSCWCEHKRVCNRKMRLYNGRADSLVVSPSPQSCAFSKSRNVRLRGKNRDVSRWRESLWYLSVPIFQISVKQPEISKSRNCFLRFFIWIKDVIARILGSDWWARSHMSQRLPVVNHKGSLGVSFEFDGKIGLRILKLADLKVRKS